MPGDGIKSDNRVIELARCFLRLANLPNFALDRLSRYEATLWRQAGRILFALDALDRRKLYIAARNLGNKHYCCLEFGSETVLSSRQHRQSATGAYNCFLY
jgi:hypothetical protein